jgi:hypothetical protein
MNRLDVLPDNWRTYAVCRTYDWTWWWEPDHYKDALHQCRVHCPVLAQCREFAAKFHWRECVVAGEVWVAKKDPARGEPSERTHRSSTRRCGTCRGR